MLFISGVHADNVSLGTKLESDGYLYRLLFLLLWGSRKKLAIHTYTRRRSQKGKIFMLRSNRFDLVSVASCS